MSSVNNRPKNQKSDVVQREGEKKVYNTPSITRVKLFADQVLAGCSQSVPVSEGGPCSGQLLNS